MSKKGFIFFHYCGMICHEGGNKINNMKDKSVETPSSIYLMHKYWGKKPSKELKEIINQYTSKGDLVLDPFAGYGGIGIEGVLENRNVILNDLNPIANFISECILNNEINFDKINEYSKIIKGEYNKKENEWYNYKDSKIITILRNNKDIPIRLKLQDNNKKMFEVELNEIEKKKFLEEENNYEIKEWYPNDKLIRNSRISAKENMRVSDLFPKRALICQSYLFSLIEKLPEGNEKKLFEFAFTSNLANCSKLVPPIKSRGEMAQGAWMTGFYIGETYLENNVFHYFENRLNKVIKGKKDYLKLCSEKKEIGKYYIKNNDAKKLDLKSNSVDFVFTDFPYGDTVPYFEQSQLWNAWLKNKVDYENEIVISDSNERNKDSDNFENDIEKSINEINRVLKNGKYFIFTFHSLSGKEWEAISNALLKNNLEYVNCDMLLQKTFTPRQLNRKITVKGDLVVVYKKTDKSKQLSMSLTNIKDEILSKIKKTYKKDELYDTNNLITMCVECLLKYNHLTQKMDFIDLIKKYFEIDKKNSSMWRLKNEL